MDKNRSSKVVAFDTLFSTNHIQMLKVLLPYADHQTQKTLAVYIKFLELNYTLDFTESTPSLFAAVSSRKKSRISAVCVRSCSPSAQKQKSKSYCRSKIFFKAWKCTAKCQRQWI